MSLKPDFTHIVVWQRLFAEVSDLYYDSDERPKRLAAYLIDEKSTVRSTAAVFGISKSTVHKDVSVRLARIDPSLYAEVQKVLEANRLERHIRGGNATKRKYALEKEMKATKAYSEEIEGA